MKKLAVLTMVCFLGIFGLISCSDDETTTELAWQNDSEEAINDIEWADGDQNVHKQWRKEEVGYDPATQTESKEVDLLTGNVDCLIFDGDTFAAADVEITETNTSSVTITEGESSVYTLSAVAKKK